MRPSAKHKGLCCAFSLLMLLQGATLLWMSCCCGDSGFEPCGCDEPVTGLQINYLDECTCQSLLISMPDKLAPVPEAFTLINHDPRPAQLSPAEHTPPTAPGVDVLYRELEASPPGIHDQLLSQSFLCIFRC